MNDQAHCSIKQRGLQQKVLDGFTLTAQHFLQQILHHIAMTAAERRDEACRVIMIEQGKCRQVQAGDPAFGARLQQPTLLGRQRQAYHLDEIGGRFLVSEA